MNNNNAIRKINNDDFWIHHKIRYNHNINIIPQKSKNLPKIIFSGPDKGYKRKISEESTQSYKLRKYKN